MYYMADAEDMCHLEAELAQARARITELEAERDQARALLEGQERRPA